METDILTFRSWGFVPGIFSSLQDDFGGGQLSGDEAFISGRHSRMTVYMTYNAVPSIHHAARPAHLEYTLANIHHWYHRRQLLPNTRPDNKMG